MPNTVNYARGPLSGITVLDLTQFLSGPFCTMIMADLGADILKIERPDRPRASGPYLHGERIYDLSVNRSKKSMTLNLKSDAGKDIFKKLLISSDVVIENFKPGTMERMGLGYEELKKIKPNLIYAAISGFGYTGPYKNRGALDMVIQGMSGLMSLTGEPNGRPTRCGTSASDIFSGIYMFGAVASALYEREKTGKGQFIDVAMLDSTSVPFQTFQTSDGEIIITCSRDSAFYSLCRAMGRPDMIQDERFAKAEARRLNKELLEDEITRFTSTRTLDECEETLNQFGVPNGRINTLTMICKDPQIAARDMIVKVEHPVAGTYQMAGSPLKFSSLTEAHYEPAPTLGQHTREILSERLNMTDTEIEALLKEQESMP